MGGGFCGIINTIMALSTMEFLQEEGCYSPGILIADSPLSMLSETEFKNDVDTIKNGLIRYLLNDFNNGQIIIVEQKEKMPQMVFSNKAINVIEFSGDENHGRYGFIPGIHN